MVNYCCVHGCGRNSRVNKHLNYYSLPKGSARQEQWLRAAGREDLLNKTASSIRFCSRHFPPLQIKRKHLSSDAMPSLCLPGSSVDDNQYGEPEEHSGVICNGCRDTIFGFRYKCIVCHDYDLCQKCETREIHPQHHMLRISKPMKFKKADNLITKWRELMKSEKGTSDYNSNSDNDYLSSDDEPITKYTKEYDSGVDLPDDVKRNIRNEVARVLKIANKQDTKHSSQETSRKRSAEGNKASKRQKIDDNLNKRNDSQGLQELAFADVDDVRLDKVVKCEPIMVDAEAVKPDIKISLI